MLTYGLLFVLVLAVVWFILRPKLVDRILLIGPTKTGKTVLANYVYYLILTKAYEKPSDKDRGVTEITRVFVWITCVVGYAWTSEAVESGYIFT
jgi:hypothetical protein